MARGRAARRLGRLAELLEPEQGPFYMRRPVPPGLTRTFPADGWYWVPHEHHTAVYLGASELDAGVALHRMIDERLDEAYG